MDLMSIVSFSFPPPTLLRKETDMCSRWIACGTFNVNQWTYNYGQLIGSLAWLHLAVRSLPSLLIR